MLKRFPSIKRPRAETSLLWLSVTTKTGDDRAWNAGAEEFEIWFGPDRREGSIPFWRGSHRDSEAADPESFWRRDRPFGRITAFRSNLPAKVHWECIRSFDIRYQIAAFCDYLEQENYAVWESKRSSVIEWLIPAVRVEKEFSDREGLTDWIPAVAMIVGGFIASIAAILLTKNIGYAFVMFLWGAFFVVAVGRYLELTRDFRLLSGSLLVAATLPGTYFLIQMIQNSGASQVLWQAMLSLASIGIAIAVTLVSIVESVSNLAKKHVGLRSISEEVVGIRLLRAGMKAKIWIDLVQQHPMKVDPGGSPKFRLNAIKLGGQFAYFTDEAARAAGLLHFQIARNSESPATRDALMERGRRVSATLRDYSRLLVQPGNEKLGVARSLMDSFLNIFEGRWQALVKCDPEPSKISRIQRFAPRLATAGIFALAALVLSIIEVIPTRERSNVQVTLIVSAVLALIQPIQPPDVAKKLRDTILGARQRGG